MVAAISLLAVAMATSTNVAEAAPSVGTKPTTRVSVDSVGGQANGQSVYATISADGRFIPFHSDASNLMPSDSNDAMDVFVDDQQMGITGRVSVGSAGGQGNADSGDFSRRPAISID